MADFDKPTDFEVWNHMRTMTGWREDASMQLTELAEAVKVLPEIKKEQDRQSIALFATDEKNEFGIEGVLVLAREVVMGYKAAKWVIYILGGLVAGVGGTLIGVLLKLQQLGVLDALMK